MWLFHSFQQLCFMLLHDVGMISLVLQKHQLSGTAPHFSANTEDSVESIVLHCDFSMYSCNYFLPMAAHVASNMKLQTFC